VVKISTIFQFSSRMRTSSYMTSWPTLHKSISLSLLNSDETAQKPEAEFSISLFLTTYLVEHFCLHMGWISHPSSEGTVTVCGWDFLRTVPNLHCCISIYWLLNLTELKWGGVMVLLLLPFISVTSVTWKDRVLLLYQSKKLSKCFCQQPKVNFLITWRHIINKP
jgi:hypothetical protein